MATLQATPTLQQSIDDALERYAKHNDWSGFCDDLVITLREIVPGFELHESALSTELQRMCEQLDKLDEDDEDDEPDWLTDPNSRMSRHHY